jgi:serine/threonine-protein kinase HipA
MGMMHKHCLLCLEPLDNTSVEYHEACSKSFFGSVQPPTLDYTMDQMDALATTVVSSHIAVTGVQPKLSLSLIHDTLQKANRKRLTVVAALGGNFILKPPTVHYPELPANEHLTMKMASLFGIETVPCSLIRLGSGELAYITKRIDRTDEGSKIHMLDMFQITDAVDKYKGSMERVGKAIAEYSSNTLLDKLRYFEVVLFCYLTGNNDMHLKNFSLFQQLDHWALSPAYDLLNVSLANPKDTEEMALTIEGKKRRLSRKMFERFGLGLGLNSKQIEGVFGRFQKQIPAAFDLCERAFLSQESKEGYLEIFRLRCAKLSI